MKAGGRLGRGKLEDVDFKTYSMAGDRAAEKRLGCAAL
jgi:hypothetical protein